MALIKRLSILFVCALILCATFLPAFAYYPVPSDISNTAWQFDSYLTSPPFIGYLSRYLFEDVSFTFGGYDLVFTDMMWDDSTATLYYVMDNGTLVVAYNAGTGWRQDNMRQIGFTAAQGAVNTRFGEWLYKNAVQLYLNTSPLPSVTWSVGGQQFTFSDSTSGTPSVILEVNSSGAVLALNNRIFTWETNLPDFTGFSLLDDNAPIYTPGNSYVLQGGDLVSVTKTLYPCYLDSPTKTTTILVFNYDGTQTLFRYAVAAEGTSPLLTLRMTIDGFKLYSGSLLVDTFSVDSTESAGTFAGFALRPNATFSTFSNGATVTVGGNPSNDTIMLYTYYKAPFSDIDDVDVGSWLATAIGGFFDFQIWPGLSLSDILLTALSLGILFTFLKMTI